MDVRDLQILSWENVIEFSRDPPGSLPVDSKTVHNRTGGLITSTGVVLVVLVLVFVVPGGFRW